MATKRGICPYCKNEYIHNSIFLVNPEAVNCFCGSNMHQITPKEAIDAYNNYILKAIEKADRLLEVTCDPVGAYAAYGEIIDIDDTVLHAYLGRVLCLLYMSKTRKSYLAEARVLLEKDSDTNGITHLVNSPMVFSFFRKIVTVIEEYIQAVKKVLTFRKYFYDTDCLALYFTHIHDALILEESIYDFSTEIQDKDNGAHDYDAFIKVLEEKIKEKERILFEYDFVTTDGLTYKYVKPTVNNHSSEIVLLTNPMVDTKTSRYRMATLSPNDKNRRYITDEIFKDYTKVIKARKGCIAWSIVFYFLSLASGICVYLFKDVFLYFILAIVGTAIFFILGTIFLILIITWGYQISEKRRKMGALQ